jgi:hypothetical protein
MAREEEQEAAWESTAVQNLVRYRPAGTYYARFRVGGRIVRQSLQTSVFSVAKQRLGDKIKEYRSRQESVRALTDGKMTVGDAVAAYQEKVRANVALKPRSKDYYHGLVDFINRSWPTLFGRDVRKVSERDCSEWLVRLQKQYAPSVVNNAISSLRSVFAEAVTFEAETGFEGALWRCIVLAEDSLDADTARCPLTSDL